MVQPALRQHTALERGHEAERMVAEHLINRGFEIKQTNYHQRFGEIDIIAQRGETLAFVEVKMRQNPQFDLAYLVQPSKQRKIIAVAKRYLAQHNIMDKVCRFDVALVEYLPHDEVRLRYIPNAFYGE